MTTNQLYPPGLSGAVRAPTPSLSHERTPSSSSDVDSGYENERFYARTPSPTPSETELMRRKGAGSGIDVQNFKKYFAKKYIINWIVLAVVLTVTILITIFEKKIINAIEPTGQKVKNLPAGFLIPIAILVVWSFPPLFGAEIWHLVIGAVWGLWAGFAITAVGTILGEMANFWVFRLCCKGRAHKYEEKNIKYGILTYVIRQEGFLFILMARLSVLPSHFTTVLFTLSDVNFFKFVAAAVLSSIKLLASVYIGYEGEESANGTETKKSKIINYAVIAATVVMTIIAMRYIDSKVDAAKPAFIHARRKSRQHQPIQGMTGEGFQIQPPKGNKGYGPVAADEEMPLYNYPKPTYPYPGPPAVEAPYDPYRGSV